MSHLPTLAGKRIVVTRARHQAAPLELLLRERGAIPISYPCIAIRAPADTRALDKHLAKLDQYDVVMLKSANAVTALSQRFRSLNLVPDWSRIRIAAVGPATDAALLSNFNRRADFVPATHTADHLAKTLPIANGSRILLPQSALAAESSAEILRARGARVIDVVAYDAVVGSGGDDVPALIAEKAVDALTFSSPSAITFFLQRCPAPSAKTLPAACLGPVTARKAEELGFQNVITPAAFMASAMLDALASYFTSRAGNESL